MTRTLALLLLLQSCIVTRPPDRVIYTLAAQPVCHYAARIVYNKCNVTLQFDTSNIREGYNASFVAYLMAATVQPRTYKVEIDFHGQQIVEGKAYRNFVVTYFRQDYLIRSL